MVYKRNEKEETERWLKEFWPGWTVDRLCERYDQIEKLTAPVPLSISDIAELWGRSERGIRKFIKQAGMPILTIDCGANRGKPRAIYDVKMLLIRDKPWSWPVTIERGSK